MPLSTASSLTFFTAYLFTFIIIFILAMCEADIRTGKAPTLPTG